MAIYNIGNLLTVVTQAAHGQIGTWLLDPQNITVVTGGTDTVTDASLFSNSPTSSVTIAPSTLVAAGTSITLQASTDITVSNAIALTTSGAAITFDAGRSFIDSAGAAISTNNGAITIFANDQNAVSGNRTAGAGWVSLLAILPLPLARRQLIS